MFTVCHLQQEIAQKQGLPRYMHLILEDYVSIRRQYNALSPAEDRYTDTDRFRSMIGRARNAAEKVQEKECNIIAYRQVCNLFNFNPLISSGGIADFPPPNRFPLFLDPRVRLQVWLSIQNTRFLSAQIQQLKLKSWLYHMAHDFRLLCQGRPTVDISHVISRDKSKPLYASACLAFYIYWTRTF